MRSPFRWFWQASPAAVSSQPDKMSFFVTSSPAGEGGDLGGLAGADAHCQRLAEAAGSTRQDVARVSSTGPRRADSSAVQRSRPHRQRPLVQLPRRADRGEPRGPAWLEATASALRTVLPESGERVRFPHDILTGSDPDGTLADGDMTCRNWTSTTGYAMFGHSDRQGGRGNAATHGTPRISLKGAPQRP